MKIRFMLPAIIFCCAVLFASCGGDDSESDGDSNGSGDSSNYFDVVTTIKYQYQQPGVEDCPVNPAYYNATLRYTMPRREYSPDGCGNEYDGFLHVLCGNDSLLLDIVESNNGAIWESGDISTSSDFLSIFRKNGKSWLDFQFSADSEPYEDPGCSGEQTSTSVWVTTVKMKEENDDDYIAFGNEIELSLNQEFSWKKKFVREDLCDIGCSETIEMEVQFIPVD